MTSPRLWLLVLAMSAVGVAFPAMGVTAYDVAGEVMCTCGCNMVVQDCNCGTADGMRALIQEKIDAGMDKKAILNDFVAEYGTKILAAPPKKGFNLTAWVLPFVVLVSAGIGVTFLIHAWVRITHDTPETDVPSTTAKADDEDLKRLRDELDEFDA